jgi:hypothetical protein
MGISYRDTPAHPIRVAYVDRPHSAVCSLTALEHEAKRPAVRRVAVVRFSSCGER